MRVCECARACARDEGRGRLGGRLRALARPSTPARPRRLAHAYEVRPSPPLPSHAHLGRARPILPAARPRPHTTPTLTFSGALNSVAIALTAALTFARFFFSAACRSASLSASNCASSSFCRAASSCSRTRAAASPFS